MLVSDWRALYKAALLEPDLEARELRIKALEQVIRLRQSRNGEVSPEERAAMQAALDALGIWKIERKERRNKFPVSARSYQEKIATAGFD